MDGFAILIAFVSFIMALVAQAFGTGGSCASQLIPLARTMLWILKLETAISRLREELQRIKPGAPGSRRHPRDAMVLEGMSIGLLMSLVSLEIRMLVGGGVADEDPRFLEMTLHILIWEGLKPWAGIRLDRQPVRLAGLAVLALVVVKVFVGNMSSLEGLFRIARFVGFGLCLVGIGWLYQHFVRRTA